jgi:hypothetical protein
LLAMKVSDAAYWYEAVVELADRREEARKKGK